MRRRLRAGAAVAGSRRARMHDALAWLQSSALGMFMRGSGPWTYPVVNVIHVLGVATLFGAVLLLDLRLLGVWRRAPLAAITTVAAPVAMAGFALAAASGVCLLAANALEYEDNPVLVVKFSAIGLGLVNAVVLRRTAAWQAHTTRDLSHPEARRLGLMGGVSLVSWLTAVGAGRIIGYW